MQDVFAGHEDVEESVTVSGLSGTTDLSSYALLPAATASGAAIAALTTTALTNAAGPNAHPLSVTGSGTVTTSDFNKYNFEALAEMVDRKEIFVFPFSLSPESQQPSGAVNFSKVSQAYLEIDMESCSTKTGIDKFQIDVWGVHYNWMMCKDGKCQLSFA
jgi:hypothetical protein